MIRDNNGAIKSVVSRAVFYVVRFADAPVMDMLNLMRFAAAPDAKRTAHITVRGPCNRRMSKDAIRRLSRMIEGAEVCLGGIGTFFNKQQNTVYLHCHSPALKAIWHKPQHSYTPHLTLYDGKSRAIAEEIRDALADADINQTRPATAITEMLSPSTTPELRPAIRPEMLRQITGIKTADELATANWQTRLQTIKTTANHLAKL
ncbi:MAG: 2'-5' RNA ligase family protein [Gammaproteobacteria bacterium]